MYKIFGVLTVVFFSLSVFTFAITRVRDNNDFDSEVNQAVRELVNQLITVKYRTHCDETVQEMLDSWFPDFFSHRRVYFVNRNYLQTLHYAGDRQWYVTVGITEGFLGDSFFIQIRIIQQESGVFKIAFLGKDA